MSTAEERFAASHRRPQVSDKEVPDTTLVLQRRIVVKILVAGPTDLPQFLVARRPRKQGARLVEPR
jgi:hypothetical protein